MLYGRSGAAVRRLALASQLGQAGHYHCRCWPEGRSQLAALSVVLRRHGSLRRRLPANADGRAIVSARFAPQPASYPTHGPWVEFNESIDRPSPGPNSSIDPSPDPAARPAGMSCCCGENVVLPLPAHGQIDLFSGDVGGEELSDETIRDFGRNFMVRSGASVSSSGAEQPLRPQHADCHPGLQGDETILFSSSSISQGTPMAAIPLKHSVKARLHHGDVGSATGDMTLAEFEARESCLTAHARRPAEEVR